MFDLKAKGITVRPIRSTGRRYRLREIFPRRRVRARRGTSSVPRTTGLALRDEHGRAMSAACHYAARPGSSRRPSGFVRLWKENGVSGRVSPNGSPTAGSRRKAYRLQTFGRDQSGRPAASWRESSVTKVFWSDLDVAIHQTALDIRGADGELAGPWTESLLFALGGPIYAGTNESSAISSRSVCWGCRERRSDRGI